MHHRMRRDALTLKKSRASIAESIGVLSVVKKSLSMPKQTSPPSSASKNFATIRTVPRPSPRMTSCRDSKLATLFPTPGAPRMPTI